MIDEEKVYLGMQSKIYDNLASRWSPGPNRRNSVVGTYDSHNAWEDYDTFLFKGIETEGKVALEYGAGPGRNMIKFASRFARIDGVDISAINRQKAIYNCQLSRIPAGYQYFVCDGSNIPAEANSYDVVFSTICFQHICCHSIRYSILENCYRVLKKGGSLCFQMGYGGKEKHERGEAVLSSYYDNSYDAIETNGGHDVSITDENELKNDLSNIGFCDFRFDIRPTGPGDTHRNWIFVRVTK